MAIDFYWGSGSPYCWRVQLALAHKRLPFRSHRLQFDRQEHKAPQMLAMNPRGRLPVLKDGDYVVFESVAVLYYLDRKYPEPPIFGRSPEEGAVIMRVISEYQAYAEPALMRIASGIPTHGAQTLDEAIADDMHIAANEARTIERRLAQSDWIVGEDYSAIDMVVYPDIRLLLHALARPAASELASRFLPIHVNYPALARWLNRVAALPGHDQTWPEGWGPPPQA